MLTFDNEGNLVCTYQNFAEESSNLPAKYSKLRAAWGKIRGSQAYGKAVEGAKLAGLGVNTGKKSDYAKNMGIRAAEGAVIGTAGGAIAGNIHGRAKRNKEGEKARQEASTGLKNRFLNAVFKDRLNNIEKAARDKVSVGKETLKGAGIGLAAGTATGAGAGALETLLKHKGNESKWLKRTSEIAGKNGAKAMLKELKGSADYRKRKGYINEQGLTRFEK